MKKIPIFLLLFLLTHVTTAQIVINELLTSNTTVNTDEDNTPQDWVELYNSGSDVINLNGYGLSDNADVPFKWIFPDFLIAPGQHLLIWCSDKNRTDPNMPMHTNFKISADGETLRLTNAAGTTVDEIPPVVIAQNASYGRTFSGGPDFTVFTTPTPSSANLVVAPNKTLTAPLFSVNSGFFDAPFTLAITHPDPEATIIYTLDGSEPDETNLLGNTYTYKNQYPEFPLNPVGPLLSNSYTSLVYTAPIAISDRTPELNKISAISTTYSFNPYYIPYFPISKGTVVRAKAVKPGNSGTIRTANYFVSGNGFRMTDLPVIALTMREDKMFGYYNGIYVAGKDFDIWRSLFPNELSDGSAGANYNRSGNAWEIKANINYFVEQNEVINQDIGVRIHGGQSRITPNKSLRIYAKSEYGSNALNYPFFAGVGYDSFKRLILRNSGGDTYRTMLRDGFAQRLTRHMMFQTQAYQPSVIYLNGEYWGIFNIQERYDDKYFKRVFDIDEDKLDYLEADGFIVEYGDNSHYMGMLEYIANNSMQDDANYNHAATLMDMDNYIDFYLTNIFIGNTDWPHNNIEFWRKRTAAYEPNAPYGLDGRWRWVLKDTDFGFGGSDLPFAVHHNTLAYVCAQQGYNNAEWPNFLFRNLLRNEGFRNQFISRFADMLNTTFIPERVNSILYQMKDAIAGEIGTHIARWNHIGSVDIWNLNINTIAQFANERPEIQRDHIREKFGISENIPVTLDVNNAAQGHIKINTIDINSQTPGVSQNPYPWHGIYFKDIPITLKAIAQDDYKFSHWSGSVQSSDVEITVTPSETVSLTAHFVPKVMGTEEFNSTEFEVYPNPFSNIVSVKHDYASAFYRVFAIDGKLLQSGALHATIDLLHLSSGMYLLEVSSEGKTSTKKLIKN